MRSQLNKWGKPREVTRQPSPLDHGLGFTIRPCYADDEPALRRLAAFDSQRPLQDRALVAEVGGELWAAIGVGADQRVIADPFRRTSALVAVLQQHAAASVPAPRTHIPVRGAGRPAAAAVR